MAFYPRFSDDSYKNWLKTTMSLQLLRSSLGTFVEKETETYHLSLREKLGDATCQSKCDIKNSKERVPRVCKACQPWQLAILENHKGGNIYWNNCKPWMWSRDKWEVAKVYMPGGNKDHVKIDQFDISAILNLMNFCKHFKQFVNQQLLSEVIHVRNQMMHSPDMKVLKEDMKKHLGKILRFVKHLQDQSPALKETKQEIEQLQKTELSIILNGLNSSDDASQGSIIKNLLSVQRLQDLEQQVFKEKIEVLGHCLEEDKTALKSEEILGMKEFLDQNKDLLEQLGPQVQKLSEIEKKVEHHEVKLSVLTEEVGQLKMLASEPALSVNPVRYKNHLLELAVKMSWPTPEFSEIPHQHGYMGVVQVREETFQGLQVHLNKIAAHQEVAKLALEQLEAQLRSGEIAADQSATDSLQAISQIAGTNYFSSVTVYLDNEISPAEGHCGKEEAIESAYKELASKFGFVSAVGTSYKATVLHHFSQSGFPEPEERFDTGVSERVHCKLKLSGPFTFHGQEASSKKKQAEQLAAKVALGRLCGVLGCPAVSGENYKGLLKEQLEARGMQPPKYAEMAAGLPAAPEVARTSSTGNQLCTDPLVDLRRKWEGGTAGQVTAPIIPSLSEPPMKIPRLMPTAAKPPEIQETQGSYAGTTDDHQGVTAGQTTTSDGPKQQVEHSGCAANHQFYAAVRVPVETELDVSKAQSEEEAVDEAYRALAKALALVDPESAPPAGSTMQLVLDYFSRTECKPPVPSVVTDEQAFTCKLHICGVFTFKSQEGTLKKQQAEQGAAKEALTRLAGVLGWDVSGANGNYKGKLQELLAKRGENVPSYCSVPGPGDADTSSSNRGTVTEIPPCESSHVGDTAVRGACVNQLTCPVAPCDTRPRSASPRFRQFYAAVRVPVETELDVSKAQSEEEAVDEAYRALAKALALVDPESAPPAGSTMQLVLDYFSRTECKPPVPSVVTDEQAFTCKLHICGVFTFKSQEGTSKKQQAEQGAAKEALTRLAGVLGWDVSGANGNYKGKLQELLAKRGENVPSYCSVPGPGDADTSSSSADSGAAEDCHAPPLRDAAAVGLPPAESIEVSRIEAMLKVYGLQFSPDDLRIRTERKFVFQVTISLTNYTFQNPDGHVSKNIAKRHTYLKFGQALGICEPKTEETQSIASVNEHFKRQRFDLPSEDFVSEANLFLCSLKVKSCYMSHEAEGPSEEAARRGASKQAFITLAPLFGHQLAVGTCPDEEAESRLNLMLKQACQPEPVYRLTATQYRGELHLSLSNLTLESRCQSRKAARNKLCTHILRLLEHEVTGTNSPSPRNQVDDWFKKRNLSQPVFQETKDGAKATFSVPLHFYHPDWQNSLESAEKKLKNVLETRFKHLYEDSN